MRNLMHALILSLCVVMTSYSLGPQSSSSIQDPKQSLNQETEKANHQIIQAAVARSLSELSDATTGKVSLSIKLRSDQPVLASSFSANGRQLLVAQGVTAFLYDLKDGVELKGFRHSGIVTSADFSPDGRFVMTGSTDKTARLWSANSGREIRRFNGHADTVTSVEFSPDGRWILTGCSDQTGRLWNVNTGALITLFRKAEEANDSEHAQSEDRGEQQEREEGYEEAYASMSSYKTFSAAFFKKGTQVITGDADQHVRVWNRLTGKLVKQLDQDIGFEWGVRRVAVSPDDRRLITLSDAGVQMWSLETGEEENVFKAIDDDEPTMAAFSPDGRFILAGYVGNKVRLLNSKTGEVFKEYVFPSSTAAAPEDTAGNKEQPAAVTTVAFTRDGGRVVAGSSNGRLAAWETETTKLIQRFEGNLIPVHSLDVSSDGRYILIGGDRTGSLWDIGKGSLVRQFEGHSDRITSARISPDGALALTASYLDQSARLWSAKDGSLLQDFAKLGIGATAGAFSPDGKFLLLGQENAAPVLWDIQSATKSRSFAKDLNGDARAAIAGVIIGDTMSVAFSRDGRHAVSGGENDTAAVWESSTGKPLFLFKGHGDRKHQEIVRNLRREEVPNSVMSVALSADGSTALSGSRDNTARLWESKSGHELRLFAGHEGDVFSVQFSPDGHKVLTTSADTTAVLWDLATGSIEKCFAGHRDIVTSAAFLTGGDFILTGSRDGTARLWETSTGRQACSLISFRDGTWVVVTPDGRFDTNNLEAIHGLNWVAPDDPFRPLPLEIFVRDYYEPRLLHRLLNGEKLRAMRSLITLNRAQPIVKITKFEQRKENPELVSVAVEASSGAFKTQQHGLLKRSGVFDLRLFRDGQLVGYEPKSSANTGAYSKLGPEPGFEEELRVWRGISRFKPDLTTGNSRTFTVRLPKNRDLTEVEFSAYAFNDDRVKSETYRTVYKLPQPLKASTKGKAYLITIGVAASEDPQWNLFYPANDARGMQKALFDVLARQLEQVVRVPLVSDFGGIARRAGDCLEKKPTRDAIKTVLDLLAGREVGPELKQLVPCVDRLRKASPDDLVLISFSGHGFGDGKGNYFIFPYDIGEAKAYLQVGNKLPETLLHRLISSEELSAWMRDIDAGEIVMILDACQSEAATGGEFKPGPMGSRGLGQLAYDKGMRLIVATQADNQAVGVGALKNGLLTYALTSDALAGKQPQKLTIKEWLEQAAEAVPKLFEDKVPPEIRKQGELQQPSVFDFARSNTPAIFIRDN